MSLMAALLLAVIHPVAAAAATDADLTTSLTNDARAAADVVPLEVDTSLQAMAQQWADALASRTVLAHDWGIVDEYPGNWCLLGENVGRGGDLYSIQGAWMDSPTHYANVVDAGYDRMGVGVSYGDDGRVYVVVDFAGGDC
jgi:uncharacterized protein YkwD